MNDEQILTFLEWTGHLEYPNGVQQEKPDGPFSRAIKTAEVMKAVASFQAFEAEKMDRLALKYHGRPAHFDGEVGPATIDAMQLLRCGHPDYGPEVAMAQGPGGWRGCHNIGDFHAATVYVHDDGMPSFLSPVFDDVWKRMQASYMALGLKWIRVDSPSGANIDFSFVSRSNGWIGLAIVGQGESCGSSIWCRYLATYRPSNVVNEWATLVMHELGHNAGLQHSRGGVMNPSIVNGLAPTWAGDPSEPILNRLYGGEPIEPGPSPGKEYWNHQGLKSNKGRTMWVPIAVPFPIEEDS